MDNISQPIMEDLDVMDTLLYKLTKSTSRNKTYEWYDDVNEILTIVNVTSDKFTVKAEVHESPLFLKPAQARKELQYKTTVQLGKDFVRVLAQSL